MGYRSQVVALIYPESVMNSQDQITMYAQLKTLMATQFKEIADDWFGPHMEWHDDTMVLKFSMEDVKWYDSYSEVQAFTQMMNEFDAANEDGIPGYCTEFMRIGEDDDDVECTRTGNAPHYYLSMRRSIDCDL